MRIDGFRFDLATILGREPHGFEEEGRFLDACRQDPALSEVKLIAEPWDCGPGGYQVGRFSPGWAEWNDAFRDTVRAYWRGDAGKLPRWRRGSRRRPTCSQSAAASRGPRSTSSRRMTASPWPTSSPTTPSTTRPTARTTRTAIPRISRATTASKVRPTIRPSPRRGCARCATCWRR